MRARVRRSLRFQRTRSHSGDSAWNPRRRLGLTRPPDSEKGALLRAGLGLGLCSRAGAALASSVTRGTPGAEAARAPPLRDAKSEEESHGRTTQQMNYVCPVFWPGVKNDISFQCLDCLFFFFLRNNLSFSASHFQKTPSPTCPLKKDPLVPPGLIRSRLGTILSAGVGLNAVLPVSQSTAIPTLPPIPQRSGGERNNCLLRTSDLFLAPNWLSVPIPANSPRKETLLQSTCPAAGCPPTLPHASVAVQCLCGTVTCGVSVTSGAGHTGGGGTKDTSFFCEQETIWSHFAIRLWLPC